MRGEIQYDGVRLTRVMPLAWMISLGLTLAVHALASAGFPLTNTGVQSTMMIAIFVGMLALVGTMQKLGELRDNGRRINAAVGMTAFLALSLGTIAYGIAAFMP